MSTHLPFPLHTLPAEMTGVGLVYGGPGTGKSTLLTLLIDDLTNLWVTTEETGMTVSSRALRRGVPVPYVEVVSTFQEYSDLLQAQRSPRRVFLDTASAFGAKDAQAVVQFSLDYVRCHGGLHVIALQTAMTPAVSPGDMGADWCARAAWTAQKDCTLTFEKNRFGSNGTFHWRWGPMGQLVEVEDTAT